MAKRKQRIPTNDTLMSGVMLDQAVDQILTHVRLIRTRNIPYLAGYSRNGKTIYIDKDLPKSAALGKKTVMLDRYLILHEAVEKALLDRLKLSYQHAHQIALRAEQAAVRANGLRWQDYDRFMQKYIKEAGDDDLVDLPVDLELKPYRDEKDLDLLKRMQQQMRRERSRRKK